MSISRRSLGLAFTGGIVFGIFACVGDDPGTSTTTTNDAGGDPDTGTAPDTSTTTALFVDPTKGDDQRAGTTPETALKTLKKAMTLAKPGYVVNLAAGIYDAGSGEDFDLKVPSSVTLTTPQKGGATLSGTSPKTGLIVETGAKLVNLKLEGFETAISVSGGKLELVGVQIAKSPYGITSIQSSTVECTGCVFTDAVGKSSTINAQGASMVTLFSPSFTGNAVNNLVSAIGTAKVVVNEGEMKTNQSGLVFVDNNASVSFNGVKATSNGGDALLAKGYVGADPVKNETASLTLDNCTVTDNAAGFRVNNAKLVLKSTELARNGNVGVDIEGAGSLMARNSKLTNHTLNNVRARSVSGRVPAIDMGKSGDAGGNTFTFSGAGSNRSVLIDVNNAATPNPIYYLKGNAWAPGTAPASGTITVSSAGSPVDLSPHYSFMGGNYEVEL